MTKEQSAIYLDSFSGAVVDLKPSKRTSANLLAVLRKSPRVSVWDMSEHTWLQGWISILENQGKIKSMPEPYPWYRFEVVEGV